MCEAVNVGPKAVETEASNAGNLHNKLLLVIGARVMLLDNVWTAVGLVNGAVGTVVDLGWAPDAQPRKDKPDVPFVVMIRFDHYSGPDVLSGVVDAPDGVDLTRVVPIFRANRDFMRGVAECSRTQFPLTIAYAIAVHKSQDATLEKAVVDISGREFQTGLSYVAATT